LPYRISYFSPIYLSFLRTASVNYIRYNVLFECYTNEYIKWSILFVLPVILIIGLVIPSVLALKIYKGKDNVISRKRYNFMIGEYKPHAWFWEFVKMYMKLLIMCCLTFYEYDIPNKVIPFYYYLFF